MKNIKKIKGNKKINKKVNEDKKKNEFFFNKYDERNIQKKMKDNYSINSVNSIFILNNNGKISDKDIEIKSPQIGDNKKYDFSIEKLNVEINSKTNSQYYENKKVLDSIDNLKSFNKCKNNFNQIKKSIKLVPSEKVQINLSPKNKKLFNTIDNDQLNKNDKKRKVKFDARILTIYYNQEEKVPNLTIKDNKNQKVEFVPLDIAQYLTLLTSTTKLKSSIVSKNRKIKKIKINLGKNKSKMFSTNLKKLKMNNRNITPDIKIKLKNKFASLNKENNLVSFNENYKKGDIKICLEKSRNKLSKNKEI
jgi:copper chaperone CopZ